MSDSNIQFTGPVRASNAAWARRIVAGCIFLVLLVALFWPILVERDGNKLTHKIGVACSEMVTRMRQQQTTGAGLTQPWPVAHPECWPVQARQ